MYRLMLYYLIFLALFAVALSFLKILTYNPADILFNTVYLLTVCWITNKVFARIFKVAVNGESSAVTALILSLIIGPISPLSNPLLPTTAAILAMASKYLITLRGKHIFNPASFGVVGTAVVIGQGASWWIGNIHTLPIILIGGFLILKKLRRFDLVIAFFVTIILISFITTTDPIRFLNKIFSLLALSPVIFFATVMLIEPLTTPPKNTHRILYAILVAFAFYVFGNLSPRIFFPLELSLLIGNIFSFMVSKHFRQILLLQEKRQESKDVISFIFEPLRKLKFEAGQYLEWTLSHLNPDSRGIRRYFTIASSPTENSIMLAAKFYDRSSTFKQTLAKMKPGDEIVVSDLGGEFTLPKDLDQKLVFIAGGVGITPFRSMAKYMIDQKENRNIVLFFSNQTAQDKVFKDIFDKAKDVGIQTHYVNTNKDGYIDEALIKKEVGDWQERVFYVSGPEPMVEAFEKLLTSMGLKKSQIKRDYFPGYPETHQKLIGL